MSGFIGVGLVALMVLVVGLITFLGSGPATYSDSFFGKKADAAAGAAQASHLPLKINLSGVIPPIFASSLLMFPATIAQFTNAPWVSC